MILPGVYETWQFLRPIADELNRRGHPVHVMHSMGINRDAIPVTASARRAMRWRPSISAASRSSRTARAA